ncbi:DUF2752 domain-containing protein [Angustibacter sp. Root456]|uniref:DUF2752 domain-containing protein n=1 Tax=Angustibacter sp. Root456 TaxID=1736539 RepID=UPI00070025A1|nr:DUF2752 domain-containing protein [Angustibacter sp. Root456]KQX66652.1 hypothetical protein ASD06_04690 [Angustibacter sp. Root456]
MLVDGALRPALLHRVAAPASLLLVAASGLAAVAVRDPHTPGAWGFCPFLLATGRPCPFCGGLRAVSDVLHGDVVAAAHSNALVLVAVPFAVASLVVWLVRRWRGRGDELVPWATRATALGGVALVAAFWLVRLLPGIAWLTPSDLLSR